MSFSFTANSPLNREICLQSAILFPNRRLSHSRVALGKLSLDKVILCVGLYLCIRWLFDIWDKAHEAAWTSRAEAYFWGCALVLVWNKCLSRHSTSTEILYFHNENKDEALKLASARWEHQLTCKEACCISKYKTSCQSEALVDSLVFHLIHLRSSFKILARHCTKTWDDISEPSA